MAQPAYSIKWTVKEGDPRVITPGQLHPGLDDAHAGAGHVIELPGGMYRMYYWGSTGGSTASGEPDRSYTILMAESTVDQPNKWVGRGGALLGAQPHSALNSRGPSFPFVLPRNESEGPWLMALCAWGDTRSDGTLPNKCGLGLSWDQGITWAYADSDDAMLWPLDGEQRTYDSSATGSVSIVESAGSAGSALRMYYTAIGEYFERPPGCRRGTGTRSPGSGSGWPSLRTAASGGRSRWMSCWWHRADTKRWLPPGCMSTSTPSPS
eukprot:SAG22_NODE_3153_length_1899_cov_20.510556_1_plen_266_part_00